MSLNGKHTQLGSIHQANHWGTQTECLMNISCATEEVHHVQILSVLAGSTVHMIQWVMRCSWERHIQLV